MEPSTRFVQLSLDHGRRKCVGSLIDKNVEETDEREDTPGLFLKGRIVMISKHFPAVVLVLSLAADYGFL